MAGKNEDWKSRKKPEDKDLTPKKEEKDLTPKGFPFLDHSYEKNRPERYFEDGRLRPERKISFEDEEARLRIENITDEQMERLVREVFLSRDCMNCVNNSSGPQGVEGRMRDREYVCSARGQLRVSIYDGEKTAKECPRYENRYVKEQGGQE